MLEALEQLEHGQLYFFRDWPNARVPQVAAGVYTIWRNTELIYVGMAGRSLTADQISVHRADTVRNKGLYSRLASHASGRRSGDQFCVYIADRFVLLGLSSEQIGEIASGQASYDALVRVFIHTHLGYRFAEVTDGVEALRIEAQTRSGILKAGRPLLNPAQMKGRSA